MGLQVHAGLVRIAVGDDLAGQIADHAPFDEAEISHEREHLRRGLGQSAVDGSGGRGGDAVQAAGLQVQRDLRVEAHAGGGDAQLAQAGRPGLGQGDTVDVVGVVQRVGQSVHVADLILGGDHLHGGRAQWAESGERLTGLGVDRMVDHVVEGAAQCGCLIGLDAADDLQLVVLVGPLEFAGDAGGGLHLEALRHDGVHGLLVAALDRAFGHYLGFALAVEHEVVGVGEDLWRAGAQGRDGAGVLGLVHDFGGHAHGELDLVCFHRHDDLSFRMVGLFA